MDFLRLLGEYADESASGDASSDDMELSLMLEDYVNECMDGKVTANVLTQFYEDDEEMLMLMMMSGCDADVMKRRSMDHFEIR